ncbi:MAG TPA: S8 family serine peptidase, partial [Longimicrobium sp.]|nr:S8 family serine peptidase [Longimicrobium sp.]
MKRWLSLAACVLFAAACTDATESVAPRHEPGAIQPLLMLPSVKVDPVLTGLLALASPLQRLEVIVTHDSLTSNTSVVDAILGTGAGVIRFKHLPMVAALATPGQIARISSIRGVVSVYSNKQLTYLMREARASIGADAAHAAGYTGKGVGIAILDSGIDGLHNQDLRHPARTVKNVKVIVDMRELFTFGTEVPSLAGDLFLDNVPNSETSVGHGTHVAGTAAGDGTHSGGLNKGVAPDANLIGVGAGDILFVLFALAGFDFILDNAEKYNIQVVNNSWGSGGEFVPEDPVNVATKELYKKGIAVVFAAGNSGPGENTLTSYSAAPWVISVAAGCKTVSPDPTNSASQCGDGRQSILADFSSRGVPGSPIYHPDVTAPGVHIVSTRASTGTVLNALDAPDDVQTCNIS